MFAGRYRDLGPEVTIAGQAVKVGTVQLEYEYPGEELFHVVRPGDAYRLDLVSYMYYDTPELWYILALHNHLKHPVRDVVAGLVLKIPTNVALAKQILQARWPLDVTG